MCSVQLRCSEAVQYRSYIMGRTMVCTMWSCTMWVVYIVGVGHCRLSYVVGTLMSLANSYLKRMFWNEWVFIFRCPLLVVGNES